MRLVIDECLHESLVGVAHEAAEATHVNHLVLTGKPDWKLADRILRDEYTFVTNNRIDFLQLFARVELHAGLIVIVPSVIPATQRVLFRAALKYSSRLDFINLVVEVHLDKQTVRCLTYEFPCRRHLPAS
jgi:predicted nuclease of predicted toxin-antitoxin system